MALEVGVPGIRGSRVRVDLRVDLPGLGATYVMLKTNDANFRFLGVDPRTRRVTQNVAETAMDVEKLRSVARVALAFVVFTFFPVAASPDVRARQVSRHLARLLKDADARLVREGFVLPPLSRGEWGIAWYVIAPREAPQREATGGSVTGDDGGTGLGR